MLEHLLLLSRPVWECVAPTPAVFFAAERLHDAAVQVASSEVAAGARLRVFAARVRGLAIRRAAAAAAVRAAIAVVPAAALLAWWLPALWPHAASIAAVALLVAAGSAALRLRLRPATNWLAGLQQAPAGTADAFATWLEYGARDDRPLAAWLTEDAAARIAPLGAAQLAAVGRRRGFDRRIGLVAVLLLLLAWLFATWFAPRWPGLFGGRASEPPPPPPPGAVGEGSSGGAPPTQGQPQPAPPEPLPEPPPEPLPDLPSEEHFVVPRYIEDGPSRKERVRAAELPVAGSEAPSPQRRGAGDRAGAPQPTAEEFRRAAERAQRARHVPPAEQAMVRRFFDLLQREGR